MLVVSVQNVKGGCGKTTTAIHLASAFASLGDRVLIADGDPQKSALSWLERRSEDLPVIEGMDFSRHDLEELKAQRRRKNLDVIVIDGRAAVRGAALEDFVKASDIVLVPIVGSPMDVEVSLDFLEQLASFKKIESGKARIGVVFNRARETGKVGERLAYLTEELELDVAGWVPDRVGFQDPLELGKTCFDYDRAGIDELQQPFLDLVDYVIA